MVFPVLIKAAGGGGGKGMRIVHSEDKLEENIKIAQTEAKKFFNNEEVFIEKFFENPRHIEVQILSDGKDNTVHLRRKRLLGSKTVPKNNRRKSLSSY